jgi:hypothetical protein
MELISVKDRLPNVEVGSFLVFSPTQFPKNSRFMVAEYYADVKMFYDEAYENPLEDVTHWAELPKEPKEQ